MKPRTKLERQIVELSASLPKVTSRQLESAQLKCFDKTARALKNGRVDCLECGGSWSDKQIGKVVTCPHCGCRLKVEFSSKKNFQQRSFFAILDLVAEYQVIRLFEIVAYMKVGQMVYYTRCEVVQRWMMPKGRKECVIMAVGACNGSYSWTHQLEVRNEFCGIYGYSFEKYNPIPDHICPGWRVWPELKRNGFNGHCYGIAPHKLFKAIRSNTIAETLLKTKQHSLLAHYIYQSSGIICELWRSICICNRNRYEVKDAGMWLDYMSMLKGEGKDILNAKFVCPKDLKAEHDRLTRAINERKKRKREEKEREKALAEEELFRELKGRFFGLSLSDGELQIRVLESVEEFLDEGKLMHHCVFSGAYYNRADSLVFSATIGDKHIETVEVSLETFKVVQSRGVCNTNTEHHDRIVNLVNRKLAKQIKSRLTA